MRKLHPLVLASALGIAGVAGARPVLAAPIVSPEIVVSSVAYGNVPSSVATINGTHLVAWYSESINMAARRVTGDGILLDPTPLAIKTTDGFNTIQLTASGSEYAMISRGQFWWDVTAISKDGVVGTHSTGVVIPYGGGAYALSSDGIHVAATSSAYMFLFPFFGSTDLSGDPSGNFWGVQLFRGGAGELPASFWQSASPDVYDSAVGLATDGQSFMALTHHIEGFYTDEYRFAVYSPQGTLLSSGVSGCSGTQAAWNGNAYLVIDKSGQGLAGCLLDSNGNKVGDVPQIGSVASEKWYPRMMWDGARTLVVWGDKRNGNFDVYGNWLLPGGAPEIPGDLPISTGADYDELGGISATSPGHGVVALSHGNKVVLRVVATDLAPLGQPCNGFDCQSGYCVDGVCCDSACGGGDPNDCQACSVAAGAPSNGACAPKSDGSTCDDGSLCTGSDTCSAGVCQGVLGECPPPPECQKQTGCDPATGACQYGPVLDGTPCSVGMCIVGVCMPDDPGAGGAGGDTGTLTTTSTTTITNTPTPTATVPGGDPAENPKDNTVVATTCAASPASQSGSLSALLTPLAIAILAARRRRSQERPTR